MESKRFLACNLDIKPLGDKSNLDYLGFDILYQILKYSKSMDQINKTCLQSKKMKAICCNNRNQIFVKILNYLGYTKKISRENAEKVFSWTDPESKIYTVKIGNFFIDEPFEIYDNKCIAICILERINNKININDISHKKHYKFYPLIYYYTSNINIKKYILNEYNKITPNIITRNRLDFYFVNK